MLRLCEAVIKEIVCVLKCPCNEKIVDPILNGTEQHFQTSLIMAFSVSRYLVSF